MNPLLAGASTSCRKVSAGASFWTAPVLWRFSTVRKDDVQLKRQRTAAVQDAGALLRPPVFTNNFGMHGLLALRSILLSALATVALWQFVPTAEAADAKPVFLYSRYFNAQGESRYLPDGNYKDLLQRLSNDFQVRAHNKPLNADTLAGVNVVLIANPSDEAVGKNPRPHHVDADDIEELTRFVRNGGALIVMGNQEAHNLEVNDMNKLLKQFGLQFTNLYTDAKLLPLPKSTPIIGGLRWGYYTGNLVVIETNHAAKPRALVMNNLSIAPAKGDRDQIGALMAISEPGKGRVIVVTDAGWLSDWAFDDKGVGGVALKGQDNWQIFYRLAHWAARK